MRKTKPWKNIVIRHVRIELEEPDPKKVIRKARLIFSDGKGRKFTLINSSDLEERKPLDIMEL